MSDQYQVEEILNKRYNKNFPPYKKGRLEYLVKWVGFPVEESTWEPLKNLTYVREMVAEYEARNNSDHEDS